MKHFTGVLLALALPLSAAPLSGTRTVGPVASDYTSLTAAIADIQSSSIGGPLVLELQADYLDTVETLPLIVPSLNGASAANTVTIRPASNASALTISSGNASAATVDLNGACFVIFDGRAGGEGPAKQLTIANTSSSGQAVRFINDADSNVLRHLTVLGVNTSTSSGTVVFSTSTGSSGNDNNLIDRCNLGSGVSSPRNAIYSSGNIADTARSNSGNTVSNCNIFNFYGSSGDAAGIRIATGNTDWTISGNSFYQTATRAASTANVRAIYINDTSGNNFTIAGNFIGGTGPNASGTAWTTTGSGSNLFQGIRLNVGATTPSCIRGNTITNMVWTSSSTAVTQPGIWTGIHLEAGKADIGSGNTIGNDTGTGAIAITTSGSGGTTFGIASKSSATVAIHNNVIGSVTTSHATNGAASLVGIQVTNGSNTISDNTIGSFTTPNSLNAITSNSTTTAQHVAGVVASVSSITASITGNTIANLNNNHNSTAAGQILGIATSIGTNNITGNTVRNLSTTSQNPGTSNSASVLGIGLVSTGSDQSITQNLVHSLSNSVTSKIVTVTGILYAGPTSGITPIARNQVHSLATISTAPASGLIGLQIGSGSFTAQNNMIRVGINASGTGTAGAASIFGILETSTSEIRDFFHNSVYIGGTQVSGANKTYAFLSSGSTNRRTIRNNIFANARSNSGATGKHYAVVYNGGLAASPNPAGLVSNNNLFLASGNGGMLGLFNNADRSTLAAWQAATGLDVSSAVADPLFVNSTGDASAVDLHLQANSPAEGGGLPVSSVADDYDGQPRSSLSPVDIGADADNQTSTGDIYAPAISYPPLTGGSTSNRTLTGWARIEDNSGSVAGGENAPRLYFKKSTDSDVFGGNTAADNGWKYTTATGTGSPYSFTVDYSILHGGTVNVGDSIQYFVVAQDISNNLASSAAAATASNVQSVQNINGKPGAGVNSYSILATISNPVTVGPNGTYPSLSGPGGLFAALNSSALTGNLTVNITGDTIEDGSTALGATIQDNYPFNIGVTLKPDSAAMRTISGSSEIGLIRLSGASHVTIDGGFESDGRYLRFRNTNTNGPTITLINDATDNIVRNCVVEGSASGSTGGGVLPENPCVILFGTGIATGNDGNMVTGNQIRDRSDAAGVPGYLIGSSGTSDTVANSDNTISNNELFNFNSYGIMLESGNESWSITGNDIHQTTAQPSMLAGIALNVFGMNTVSGNTVHDMFADGETIGITLASKAGNTILSGNRIWNLGIPGGAVGILIHSSGSGQNVAVVNNMICLGSTGVSAEKICGISDAGLVGNTVSVACNTVLITGIGMRSDSWAYNNRGNTNATVKNNIFLNLRASYDSGPNSSNNFAANRAPSSTGTLVMDFNVYAGTGQPTVSDLFDGSSGIVSIGLPISHAQWLANVPGDTHSSASVPGGNYSSAMFVNVENGDLHLVPNGNPLVNNTGTPIPGLTSDYDGQLRNASQPNIGADELFAPVNQPPAYSGYVASTQPNTPTDIGHAALLARASDSDGGALAIQSVDSHSAMGGSVTNISGKITYTPPAGHTGLDIFSISITDSQGGEVSGSVTVNVIGSSSMNPEPIQFAVFQNEGRVALLFLGIPGQSYKIQRSTDLMNWTSIETVSATNDGNVPFTDPSPPPGAAFYRIALP